MDNLTKIELKYFIKMFKLPIVIPEKNYIIDFINMTDDEFDISNKMESFLEIKKISEEENIDIFTYVNNIKNEISDWIKNNDNYIEFCNDKSETINLPQKINNFYKNNDYKYFISIDILSANFTCLKCHDSNIVDNEISWENFLKKFTKLDFFQKSKHFRQLVFGNLNMKKIMNKQKQILCSLCKKLDNTNLNILGILGADEIIIESSNISINKDYNIVKNIIDEFYDNNIFRIECCMKYNIDQNSDIGMIKRTFKLNNDYDFTNSEIYYDTFKCVPKMFFNQVYCHHYDKVINLYRLTHIVENKKCIFSELLFKPIYSKIDHNVKNYLSIVHKL